MRALVVAAVSLTTGTAVAAVPLVPTPLAYWSTGRAERSLIAVNPQPFATTHDPSSLAVAATCKGVGRSHTTPHGVRQYHLFDCRLTVAYDGNGGMLVRFPATRWCAYTHHGIDEIVEYGHGGVPGCG